MISRCSSRSIQTFSFLHMRILVLVLLPFCVFAQPFTKKEIDGWKKRANGITIIRDKWGVPHIYGKTDADAVFGLLYAQCEDDFDRVEMNYINAMGRLAEVQGEDQIFSDLRTRLYNDTLKAISQYQESPAWLKKLMDAFAGGSNYFLATHPEIKPRLIRRFQPWMPLLFSEGSIGGDLTSISVQRLKSFYANVRLPREMGDDHPEPRGSNGFAIAPARSESGKAMLLINPHTSFYFRSEVHVVSQEGLNAYGAVTWGQFFVYQGFNENCGWMHTSTYADAVDEFLETVARRGDTVFYKHDGNWKRAGKREVTIAFVKNGRVERNKFQVYDTHHGPVIANRDGKWMTIRMMDDPINALQQSFLRTKAKGYDSYKEVMKLNANSSNNTVFADKDGNIAYWHGNFIPRRDQSLNWNLPVDGSDPRSDWKGFHSIDEIIQLKNPSNGWIQNCNSTPFTAAAEASPRKENYPAYMAPDGQNFRALNADRVLRKADKLNLDKLISAAYDPALTAFEKLIPSLKQAYDESADTEMKAVVAEPLQVLMAWDYRSGVGSVGATLAMEWGRMLQGKLSSRLSDDELATHRSDIVYQVDKLIELVPAKEKLLAFRVAVERLKRDFDTWQIPWGEINRFQRLTGKIDETFDDSKPSLPVGFASSFWGSLPAFGRRVVYPDTLKRYYGVVGNSFVAVVEFGERIRAKSIVTGGSASRPGSPHFNDQGPLYVKGEFKEVLFYKEDILKNAERTYQLGK
jgi:acyl-homoserine-lactone acylase